MGYTLEFYSLDWTELQSLLGSGDKATFESIVEANQDSFGGTTSEEMDWQAALEDLIAGKRGRVLFGRGPAPESFGLDESSPEEAMAMVAIVRARGQRIGELLHATRSGAKFRQMFDPEFRPAIFNTMSLLPFLLQRPLFSLPRQEYPFWGGLKKDEIRELLGNASLDEPVTVRDSDYEDWLYNLKQILVDAKSFDNDLVTLYL